MRTLSLYDLKTQAGYLIMEVSRTREAWLLANDGVEVTIRHPARDDENLATIDLNKYVKNRQAMDKTLDRAFADAASGKKVKLKMKNWEGYNYYAVLDVKAASAAQPS
jgi:hypothetical protein